MAGEAPVLLTRTTHASATIILNRPKQGNAINPALSSLFLRHLADLADDDSIHSVIITGNGRFFCTGMDLVGGAAVDDNSDDALWSDGKRLFDEVDNFPKPTIALINGPCYGGGVGLAFACDFRISLSGLTFNLPEVRRGLIPAIISKYVIREWGSSLSRSSMLTGSPVPTSVLLSQGSLYSTHSDLIAATEATRELAKLLTQSAPRAMLDIKDVVRQGHPGEDAEAGRKRYFVAMMRSGESAEGITKWRNKEPTDWVAWRARARRAKL